MRRGLSLLAFVALAIGGIAAGIFVSGGGAGTTGAAGTAAVAKVTVTAREFKFVLSKKTVPKGTTVVFTVVNKGKIAHDFKISGKKTKTLKPGQTTTLRVAFPKKGAIAFICTLPGHAPAGMKGKFGVGVAAPPPPVTTTTPPSTTPPPTTTPGGAETLQGDPVAGKAVFAASGCASWNVGPNLDQAKPSQALVRTFVQNGSTSGGISMPAFSNMSQTDLNNVAAFVYASTH
jgi:uncharacterized cupredoxin-like copper-binding protein